LELVRKFGRGDEREQRKASRRAVAVHEAGHAVAAWALGVRVVRLWIDDNGCGGADTAGESQLSLVDQIAICRAGQEATIILRTEAPPHMAQRDRACVLALISRLSDDEQDRMLDLGRRHARDLLARNGAILRALAVELEQAGSVDDATFLKITQASSPQ
jgi:hypothetical protein